MNPPCPACNARTTVQRWADVTGYECVRCSGHFVPAAALQRFFLANNLEDRFAKLTQAARDAPTSPRSLRCPECREPSFRVLRVGGVELDACASCIGLYFDAHEATGYFRATRDRLTGGKVVKNAVNATDGTNAILDFIMLLIP